MREVQITKKISTTTPKRQPREPKRRRRYVAAKVCANVLLHRPHHVTAAVHRMNNKLNRIPYLANPDWCGKAEKPSFAALTACQVTKAKRADKDQDSTSKVKHREAAAASLWQR